MSFSIKVAATLLLGVLAGGSPVQPVTLSAAPASAAPASAAPASAAELSLAETGEIYLFLDLAEPALEVRSRGIRLESLALTAASLYRFQRWGAAAAPGDVQLPAVWRVTEDSSAAYRHVVAPERLAPFSEEGGEDAVVPPPVAAEPLERPDTYQVALDGGFVLTASRRLPSGGLGSRLAQALGDGWQRWYGRTPPRPDLVAVALAAEDARQLHALLRPGTAILVTGGAAAAAAGKTE